MQKALAKYNTLAQAVFRLLLMKLCIQCEAPERRHKVGTTGAIKGNTQRRQSDSKK